MPTLSFMSQGFMRNLTIPYPCARSALDTPVDITGSDLSKAISRNHQSHQGRSHSTNDLVPLVLSICEGYSVGMPRILQELAELRVQENCIAFRATEETRPTTWEMAALGRALSVTLQDALYSRTRACLKHHAPSRPGGVDVETRTRCRQRRRGYLYPRSQRQVLGGSGEGNGRGGRHCGWLPRQRPGKSTWGVAWEIPKDLAKRRVQKNRVPSHPVEETRLIERETGAKLCELSMTLQDTLSHRTRGCLAKQAATRWSRGDSEAWLTTTLTPPPGGTATAAPGSGEGSRGE